MAPDEQELLRLSGFRRILVRLDEGTRRKYCCQALEQDLQRAKGEMDACAAAMAQVKQVEDATRRLEAGQRAAVSEELLVELEAMQTQLESSVLSLFSNPHEDGVKEEDGDLAEFQEAKTLAKLIVQNGKVHDAVTQIKRLGRVMPVLAEVDEKKRKWWKSHVLKVVSHGLELLAEEKKNWMSHVRLGRAVKKIAGKCPELQDWHRDVDKKLDKMKQVETAAPSPVTVTTKSKKKRAIALPDDGESALASRTPTKRTKTKDVASSKEKKSESVEKARSLLNLCSREVRMLRDKFKLGAYDVNLSRMVAVVDSLWPGFEHSEVVSLTTALFTLVETVEKVVSVDKRRDRLVCLESVLGVVLGSSKLQLAARRKIMVEEYANNCRQSLEQLNRQLSGATAEPAAPLPAATTGSKNPVRGNRGACPKSHVRFG
uniref:Uncharacterized protein n=1 Tax=Phytophthora ramorum TaxID=164328 RepID=H3GLZ8_PHYRM